MSDETTKVTISPDVKAEPVEHKFPTEIITLPSKGFFYSEDSPLSKGELELKYMTAKEEDILMSQSLIRKGVVLDKLLEAVIVDKDVNTDDLLLGDKNAILVAMRIMAYGPNYNVIITCPSCGEKQEEEIDLKDLPMKEVDYTELERGVNKFEFVLPRSERVVEWQLMTQGKDREIDEEIRSLKKFDKSDVTPSVSTRYRHIILSIDGNASTGKIKQFVDNEFLTVDIRALRAEMDKYIPDVDLSYQFDCESCGAQEEVRVPMGPEFFWPAI